MMRTACDNENQSEEPTADERMVGDLEMGEEIVQVKCPFSQKTIKNAATAKCTLHYFDYDAGTGSFLFRLS